MSIDQPAIVQCSQNPVLGLKRAFSCGKLAAEAHDRRTLKL